MPRLICFPCFFNPRVVDISGVFLVHLQIIAALYYQNCTITVGGECYKIVLEIFTKETAIKFYLDMRQRTF